MVLAVGEMKMNEDSCDINDVTHAASDLIAFGCHLGATQLYDSFAQLRFSEIVVGFANEVIGAVNDGIVSPRCQDSCRLSGFSKKSISGAERDWSCRTIHLNAEPHYLRCCFPR